MGNNGDSYSVPVFAGKNKKPWFTAVIWQYKAIHATEINKYTHKNNIITRRIESAIPAQTLSNLTGVIKRKIKDSTNCHAK
ncbi:hypothetical protein GWD52_12315 [Enterobacteriaceae bacterium 4M9]|nr:hypothetical protein [Enterobacteriaceae bacterium 4M9]